MTEYVIVKYKATEYDIQIFCKIIKQKFTLEHECIDFIKKTNPKIVFLHENNNKKYTNNIELAEEYSDCNNYFYDKTNFLLECFDENWCFGIIPIKTNSRSFSISIKTLNENDNFMKYHFDNKNDNENDNMTITV